MTEANGYFQLNNVSHFRISDFIHEFEDELSQMSGKCMDICCGIGDVTRYFLLPALNVKAIVNGTDISENLIKRAKETHSDEKRLEFETLDIQTKHLPVKYVSEYNHVFSLHVLHWCNDMRQVFENIYRLLQPGGTMLIILVTFHDVFDILYQLSQDIRYTSYVTHSNNSAPKYFHSIQPAKELKMLLKDVGFNVLQCSHRERTYSAQVANEFPGMILSFITEYLRDMPHDRMEQFKNDFTQEYRRRRFSHKQIRNKNERIVSDLHEVLVVYAQKSSISF